MDLVDKKQHVLQRKLLTASLTGALFAILLGLFVPSPFGSEINSIKEYLWSFTTTVPLYLMYSFPVIFVYGTVTSIISDFLSGLIAKNRMKRSEPYLSFVLHLLFGSILQWVSLGAAILYFIIDRMLRKMKNRYKWRQAFIGLAIPFLLWIFFMGIIWIMDLFKDGADFIVF
ncbi:hypothetical protein E1I69_09345 [Bacillus timonensis]|uniref:Uncharacterized protein n=1 Tax=Bacillus timonensis TaxID=1033734 RepID=A0A4S3PU97_9BACI|nr:hypothetical protein [Bacillus timonensis]THE13064.1 hypothetical protein E1I69_09345 [Bacillus timonensis]